LNELRNSMNLTVVSVVVIGTLCQVTAMNCFSPSYTIPGLSVCRTSALGMPITVGVCWTSVGPRHRATMYPVACSRTIGIPGMAGSNSPIGRFRTSSQLRESKCRACGRFPRSTGGGGGCTCSDQVLDSPKQCGADLVNREIAARHLILLIVSP
jgi:hypothetical protein